MPEGTGHLGDTAAGGGCVLLVGAGKAPEFLVSGGGGLEGDAAGERGVGGGSGAEDVVRGGGAVGWGDSWWIAGWGGCGG